MRHTRKPVHCATASLFGAVALLATPALAQDIPAQTTPAPAPVVVAPPPAPTVLIPPVVETAPEPIPEAATPTPRPAPRTVTRTTRTETRTTRATPSVTRAPAAASKPAPAPEPVPAPVAAAPAAPVVTPAPEAQVPPADTTAIDTSTTETTTATGAVPTWMWIAGLGAAALLLIGFFALRRRRTDEYDEYAGYEEAPYVEPAPVAEDYVAPVPVAAPDQIVMPTPVVAADPDAEPEIAVPSEAAIHEPDKADLAAVTEATAPVAHRPWLEFAFRPIRAGTNIKEALVELELTVGNAGDMRAEDVRVSTFMLPQGTSEMESLLIPPPEGSELEPMTLEAGEGRQIDTTLAIPVEGLISSESFSPVIVADARYTLADGREGRTSAAFLIGVGDEDGTLHPIALDRPRMHHDVEARLHGNLERA